MKKNVILLSLLLVTSLAMFAQKLSWQAVVRDNDNKLVSNRNITVEASVLNAADATVFKETHNATTNINGMLSLTIGDGNIVSGSLSSVDWVGAKIKTVITWPGNSTGITNITPVNAVPYALYAASAGNSVSQVNADWNATTGVAAILNKPHIHTTEELQALFGQYLANNGNTGTQVNADWNATTGVAAILNKPHIYTTEELENLVGRILADSNYLTNNNCQSSNYCDLLQRISDLEDEIEQLKNQSGNNNNDTNSTAPKPCPEATTAVDQEGNVYQTVKIGSQCWLKTNLRTKYFSDGTPLTAHDLYLGDIPMFFESTEDDILTYGLYYNAEAALSSRGLCPVGWHVPSDEEWTTLANYVKNNPDYLCNSNINNTAKAFSATTSWQSSTGQCTPGNKPDENNKTGFSAIAAGKYYATSNNGVNHYKGQETYFWSRTRVPDSLDCVRTRTLSIWENQFRRNFIHRDYMVSVRCVRGDGNSGDSGGGNANIGIDTTETATSCPGMPTVTDNEGNMYQTVKLGTQCWMKSNLRTKHYNDGSEISNDYSYYSNDQKYYFDYSQQDPLHFGFYYSGNTVSDNRGICPQGWHVPSVNEYKTLISFVKSQANYLCDLNQNNISSSLAFDLYWYNSGISCTPSYATNATDFSAFPAGSVSIGGQVSSDNWHRSSMFWTSVDSINSPYYKHSFQILYDKREPEFKRNHKSWGLSVRCIRDLEIEDGGNTDDGYSNLTDTASCANTPIVTDIDGNIYKTVQIGNQCWMRSNLRTTTLSSGVKIQNGKQSSGDYLFSESDSYFYTSTFWFYDFNSVELGLLYNNAAANLDGICPQGWKVPSLTQMQNLVNFLVNNSEYRCDPSISNSVAKSLGTNGDHIMWYNNNCPDCSLCSSDGNSILNKTNFSAYPVGYFSSSNGYINGDHVAGFWPHNDSSHNAFILESTSSEPKFEQYPKTTGFSIRCIKE